MTQLTPPTWSRGKGILGEGMELPAELREAYLDGAWAGEPALRRRIGSLISAYTATNALADADSPARSLPGEAGPGSLIGRYRVIRLIGRGGMGAVYEAKDEQLGRPVAVKLLHAGLASHAMVRRFELEPRLLARLKHPGIAQIFEAGTVPGDGGEPVPFFSMELVADAMPITTFADSRALSAPERPRLFIRVCEAVTHGHQRGVLHRDLKPANILVDGAGNPKVIDFGVGRASDPGGAATTVAGELLGTVRYMSPEQIAGDPDDIDVRADVYALGVVLYELLSGQTPHPDSKGGVLASIRDAQTRTPLPLSRLAPELSGDIETVALKAVAPDRNARYQSVVEFASDLARILNHEPISARPQSAIYHLRLFARRNRALVVGAAAIFAALTLGVIGTSIGLVRARLAEKSATAQTRRAQRIAEFLENTIRSADPQLLPAATLASINVDVNPWEGWVYPPAGWGSAGPAEVGVTGVLRHAAEHLESEFGDDPALQAEISILLSHTLAAIEERTTSERLLASALATQSRLLDNDDETLIRTRLLYGNLLVGVGRPSEAVPVFRTALDSARRRFGPMDPRTLCIVGAIAVSSPLDGGLELARKTISEVSAAKGPDSAPAWLCHVPLIDLLHTLRETTPRAEILAECRATIDGLTRTIGPDAPPIAHVCACLALEFHGHPADIPEAESLLRRAIAIDSSFRGADSGAVYDERTSLYVLNLRQHKFADAEALARQMLDSSLRLIGPRSPYTFKAEGRLARVLTWEEREPEEAERLGRSAAERAALEYGPAEDYAAYHHAIWAAAVRQRHHPDQAEAMLRERIELRGPRPLQADSAWVEAYQFLQLALCLADQNRPD